MIRVTDLRNDATFERHFLRSPVNVGRSPWCELCLEAADVSDFHGAFVFTDGYLRFVDLRSTNGTTIDGTLVEPERSIAVSPSAVMLIWPFRLTARLGPLAPAEPDGLPAALAPPPANHQVRLSSPVAAAAPNGAGRDGGFGRLVLGGHQLAELDRALEVVEAVACIIVAFRRPRPASPPSPLLASDDVDEIIHYLLDTSADADGLRMRELVAVLTEIFDPATARPRQPDP